MDYVKSFTFVFDDTRWVTKIAIGTGLVLLSTALTFILVGIVGFFILAGYSVRLLQNVRDGREFPLPEWDDWGGDLVRGLKLAVVGFIWALPIFIFFAPIGIGSAIADSGGAGEFFGVSILLCGSCLMMLYGLFFALATPGFSIAYAQDEHISSGLRLTEIWEWTRANIGQVIIAVIVIIVASLIIQLVAGIAGTIACLVGLIITIPLASLATSLYTYHLYGQLAYQFPYDGVGGAGDYAPIVPAGPVGEEGSEEIVAIVTEESAPASESAADEEQASDQPGEEEKPA